MVESASFTRAADTLGMPRSSVSAAVAELEARMGARLLHRTTRKVAPTQDGTAFYRRCQQLIADVEEAENLFRQSSAKPSGKLRVDVPGRIGRLIIAPALPTFLDDYPDIDITLGVTDRAVDLIGEGVDCALRIGPLRDSSLVARGIGTLPLVNVGSPDYFARHGVPATPTDLVRHQAVNYASPSSGKVEPWGWMEGGVWQTIPMRGRITVNNTEAYLACCLAGLGLIQIPAYDVRYHLDAGKLVSVLPNHCAKPMPINFLYAHRQHLSRRVQVFADWLHSLLRDAMSVL